jgi:2-keto-4-pentenoate hydratase
VITIEGDRSMTHELDIEELAADLLRARDEAQVVTPPSRRDPNFDLKRGYSVGRSLHERLVGRGYHSVGRKIGLTNPVTWQEFNVDTPIWAHMYAQTVRFAFGGCCSLSLSGMVAPRLEPEVVLKLRRPVPAGELPAEELISCVEWFAIGFEIVDTHYPNWRFSGADAVADFGVHAALVVGDPWLVASEDLRQTAAVLEALRVTLRGGQNFVAEGEGRNVLGSPLLALGHLARVLATQPWAPPLTAGEVITTGTLTALPHVRPGESYRVDVSGAPLALLHVELIE